MNKPTENKLVRTVDGRKVFFIDTEYSQDELLQMLRKWEPWRHEVVFSNGVRTSQLNTIEPFTDYPLSKIHIFENELPFETIRGGKALDIGSNCGYNSLYLASQYDLQVTGIDVTDRHIEVGNFLTSLTDLKAEFLIADASTYHRASEYDLVLHLGTLYHLPNPFLSLQSAAKSLKMGGYLAIETQTYENSDDPSLCKYINGLNGDMTNYWALSAKVIGDFLKLLGFPETNIINVWSHPKLGENQTRTCLYAKKETEPHRCMRFFD